MHLSRFTHPPTAYLLANHLFYRYLPTARFTKCFGTKNAPPAAGEFGPDCELMKSRDEAAHTLL